MSREGALKNVGELASPYFLLELWVRRDEIDIDPETFATLKQKSRKLVRDARGFENRGEEPDEDWHARRRELLGLEAMKPLTVNLDGGSAYDLGVWSDLQGRECLLVGDLHGFAHPDERPEDAPDPPSTSFELALDAYEGDADWGLLLSGYELRIYRRSSGISQQYLSLNLESLAELDDDAHWRAFAGLFRAPAFALGDDGVPLIRRVVDESRRHAAALAEDMRADVVDAAESIIQGALDHPDNQQILGDPGRDLLQQLFEETLYYLYRLLFLLYAEARDVLPLSSAGPYATTYSVDHLVERARQEPDAEGRYYSDALARLFTFLSQGDPALAKALDIEPVGGELFDPSRTSLLDRCAISDHAWRRALVSIAIGAPGSRRARLGRRSSFAELGVEQLGSIYEGLLVLEPFLAPGPRLLIKEGNDRRVVVQGGEGGLKIVRELHEGDFVLESASGRRKGSGSFYTPEEITEYLARAALEPLVEPIVASAAEDVDAATAAILKLKVCDPAMGSGAFLVQAARVLGRALARVRAARKDGRVTPEMVKRAERDVVRNCIYGVDLNPLAVALAKVSLWLETLEKGRPLNFLDAQLKCGDSLVGIDFISSLGTVTASALTVWPKDAVKGLKDYLKKEAGERGKPLLQRLEKRKAVPKAKQAQLPGLDTTAIEQALGRIATARSDLMTTENGGEPLQLELSIARAFKELEEEEDSLRNKLRRAADFVCAQWFSEGEDSLGDQEGPVAPSGQADFEEIVAQLIEGAPLPGPLRPQIDAAMRVSRKRRFFHWALEFPEAMVDQGGFDAVIGNPPWNTLSPDVKEFFSTYDQLTFKRGVPKGKQEERKKELLLDPDIDSIWRREARFLYELSAYSKPEGGHFEWYAEDGQLRKGDANVFRLFVERAYKLLRKDGRMGQVLPDSVYVSSPATGVRQKLLTDGVLERCYVFENRRHIFPIDSRIKVVLLTAIRSGGPTERFRASFHVGTDAAGRVRAVSLEELPSVLADLDEEAPTLAVDQIRALAPATWSFPELQTALDAEIAAHCATNLPPLNLDERGWKLTYCRELDADKDAWRFTSAEELESKGANRLGLRWFDNDGIEWWPLIEGYLFYELEFPAEGKVPDKWVNGSEVRSIEARRNADGTSVMDHYRVTWRDIARSVDERSAIASLIPPRTAAKDKALTVWGGSMPLEKILTLVGLMSSFCFDYLHRFRGATHLKYAALNSISAPSEQNLASIVPIVAEAICRNEEFDALWEEVRPNVQRPTLSAWEIAERRSLIDAEVALGYGLTLDQFGAVLSAFPNLDTIQPMLPGEPKSFVTRDLALLAYCELVHEDPADISKLLASIGVDLPEPRPEFRRLDDRITKYKELGAVPYRPTPRGGRKPTDPELIESVLEQLSSDPMTATDIAEAIEEEESAVSAVLKKLAKDDEIYSQGKGKSRSYYVIEEE